jgi:ATP-dependent Clp protease protease subunit
MRFIKPKVGTIVTGMAASMGFAILTAGEKGMRFALPNAQIMAHRVSSGAGGHVEDMRISFEHSMHIDTILAQLIADNIGMKKETYLNHVIRDKWLTANESLTFGKKGVIDRIITTRNEL